MEHTAYTNLVAYHAKNIYKRGSFAGDAPCDKRSKNHFRIIKPVPGRPVAIRFWRTDIVTIDPDGTITLRADGHESGPTTRAAFEIALHRAGLRMGYLTSTRRHGVSQTEITTTKGEFIFYDGMQLSQAGELLSAPAPVKARRIDREASKQLSDGVKASGFKDMFPVLYATCEPQDSGRAFFDDVKYYVTDADYADRWSALVAQFKYVRRWDHSTNAYRMQVKRIDVGRGWPRETREQTAKDCWSDIMKVCKARMYDVVSIEAQPEANI